MRRFLIILGIALLSYSTTDYVYATIFHVPGVYPTIQEAVDATANGDTVLIADGTYTGSNNTNIYFGYHEIVVMSENGSENCIVDCEGNTRGFHLDNPNDTTSVIQGIQIINGDNVSEGGGIFLNGASPTIRDCFISNCTSTVNGGGVSLVNNSNSDLVECQLIGNSANGGGAIYCSGSDVNIINNLIVGNSAENGGVVVDNLSSVNITNSTIVENTASSLGGGIYAGDDYLTIKNCIVWNNYPQQIYVTSATTIVTFSNIEEGWEGEGNINTDPFFVDPANGDYHLQSIYGSYHGGAWLPDPNHSPCIDAGDPDSDYSNEPEQNGGCINMGAYGNTEEASKSSWFIVEITYVSGSPVPPGGGNLFFDVLIEYLGLEPIDYDAWLDGYNIRTWKSCYGGAAIIYKLSTRLDHKSSGYVLSYTLGLPRR